MPKVTLYGLPLSPMSLDMATESVLDLISSGRMSAVYTPNSEMIERSLSSPELFALLSRGDRLFPDGSGVALAIRLLCNLKVARLCGVELGERLACEAAHRGLRVFLYGGRPGIAERAAAALVGSYPSLNIVGYSHGYLSEGEQSALLCRLNELRPQLIFVCLGFPRQEEWIDRNINKLSFPCVALALGGSLDVYAGGTVRAPEILQSIGLEWLWRLALQPSRLPRVLPLFRFALRVAAEAALKPLAPIERMCKKPKSCVRQR